MKKIFALIMLSSMIALGANAQSAEQKSLSKSTTETLNHYFSMGPNDNSPDTMYTAAGSKIVWNKAMNMMTFFTKSGWVIETNLNGGIFYASDNNFIYYFVQGKEVALEGTEIINDQEKILAYISPIIAEIDMLE